MGVISLVAACLLFPAVEALATEVVVTNPKLSALDKRFDYPFEILNLALARTGHSYGDFEIERYPESISRNRALRELEKGNLTVFSAPARAEWERRAIPVRIPLRKGLMGYRLFLIRAQDEAAFSRIETLEQLQRDHRIGQGLQWSTTAALKKLGFAVEGSNQYESLFGMLAVGRFDYFPRSVTEIFDEYELRSSEFPDMRIEGTLALYLPLPYYFFVTPKRPELAKRIEEGLLAMVEDGTLDTVFLRHHRENIERANLASRRIFHLENPDLTAETPFRTKEFWIDPNAATGIQ